MSVTLAHHENDQNKSHPAFSNFNKLQLLVMYKKHIRQFKVVIFHDKQWLDESKIKLFFFPNNTIKKLNNAQNSFDVV